MPIKYPVSGKPLTREDFSKKYWLDGDAPYQYHTMEIEDGRDEIEQLIINNVRAIMGWISHPKFLPAIKSHAEYPESSK